MFDTVLVANRGEIAVRVIRTLRELGIRSVAVFSDADADARHVHEADAAVRIGPPAAAESYLRIDRLVEAAVRSGAQAIHPGYGFLAENAEFASVCASAGLVFIGPPASAISLMGDKIRAKETVRAAGVPVVPGSSGSGLTDDQLADSAREIGMPVLLKPSAGGGGKGMRLVRDAALLGDEIAAARREARSSFGDDTLLVERWIDRPRHIEIQVLADGHGNVVHLGERECSLQRRHQKIIEEAPSVLLDEATRAAMGEAAVQAARSCGYSGAGTVEFIVPGDDPSSYFFMEMNTRLQVEHPVTELITGIDLVEWQLRVASGAELPFTQADITLTGHAIEARVCAEDPSRGFLPSGGTILALHEPQGNGVRTDSGLSVGTEIGSLYDPMLSKVIAYGPDRPTALRKLRAALAATVTLGVQTNAGFLRRLLAHPDVVAGNLDTGLVERDADSLVDPGVPAEVYAAAGLLAQAELSTPSPGWADPFDAPSGWRLGGTPAWTAHHFKVPGHDPVTVRVREGAVQISPPGGGTPCSSGAENLGEIEQRGPGGSAPGVSAPGAHAAEPHVSQPGRGGAGDALPARLGSGTPQGAPLTVEVGGLTHTLHHHGEWLGRDGDAWHLQAYDPVAATLTGSAHSGADALTAPMPGTVTVVKVAVGDHVTAGQSLLVVEAMKMEHVISAPHSGTVAELDVKAGATVAMDQVLAVVTPDETPGETPDEEEDTK
ncbi:acetyl/propionyl/methylcrotonyl-CoA carboxylase subunit alpha [Streptomyces sp. NBC_00237]|uniref:acetyl/propionyl/methylcrotonyl-CoA carboxylase subunit alpha n=1 Tax=Streptomyces sp. NBC_00237 TaxID=2975687 RepID=UPI00224F0312|nr:acetyl/propionyl/methylcrotonyl-CoA carboxylase subunit alpha [Streptomyces sp. NBC_00237]MCX5201110.1 acetyl/propionyl/methylcrotonyl-CoA carboxylase subunit alpha [Streptomyces sp. NBC_00237]